jgi:hypothetical protein
MMSGKNISVINLINHFLWNPRYQNHEFAKRSIDGIWVLLYCTLLLKLSFFLFPFVDLL